MPECHVVKRAGPILTPSSDEDKEVLDRLPPGQDVRISFVRVRNLKFHRKWFALARFAYDYWEPELPDDFHGVKPEKNFDRFRKDLIILAGFYDATYQINDKVRIEAKSIAFDNMSEEEFEKLYDKTISVVLKHICSTLSKEEVDNAVDGALSFA
jgi:hypothetical protein